jgi:hypothetical protein
MAKKRKKKKGRKVSVNMEGVQVSRNIPEAEYVAKVHSVEQETSDSSGADYLNWEFVISRGKYKGRRFHYNTSLQPQALWNLRGVLESLNQEVPDSAMDLDLDELENIEDECGLSIELDEYEGKKRSKIMDVIHLDMIDDEQGEDGMSGKPTEKEIKKMDEDELEEVVDDHELGIDLDEIKGIKKKRAAVIEALEDSGDNGDETPDVDEMDEDELEELIEERDLDVDLDDYKTLKKKRKAVAEALEESGEEEGEEDTYDEEDIMKMKAKELKAIVEKHQLKVKLPSGKANDAMRKKVVKALDKRDLLD